MKNNKDLALHEKDTGSSEIQIAQLTTKIKNLSDHVKSNKKSAVSEGDLNVDCIFIAT